MSRSPYPARLPRPGRLLRRRGLLMLVAVVQAFVVTVTVYLARRLVRLEVAGVSMVPALAPGDRVLVWKTDRVRVGDLVAIRDPDEPERILVKRVTAFDSATIRVEGDNPGASRDSRHFGPVPRSAVIGTVLTRYFSRADRRVGRGR